MRTYIHTLLNLPGILARLERELQSKASSTVVAYDNARFAGSLEIVQARLADRPTQADLSQTRIDLGVRLDRLEAIIEKTGLADLATTLAEIAADGPEPGLRESIRETIAKATANVDAAKARAPRKPKGGE